MDNKIMRMSSRVYQEHNNKLSNRVLKKKKRGHCFLAAHEPTGCSFPTRAQEKGKENNGEIVRWQPAETKSKITSRCLSSNKNSLNFASASKISSMCFDEIWLNLNMKCIRQLLYGVGLNINFQ